jgi:nucleoid DNA-binding protein
MAKATKKPPTKTELLNSLSEATDLPKKEVSAVLDALAEEVRRALGNRGAGMITIPGLVKIERKKKPAQPAIKNWKNPFSGEIMDKPAKPASVTVKVRALKKLKDMV